MGGTGRTRADDLPEENYLDRILQAIAEMLAEDAGFACLLDHAGG